MAVPNVLPEGEPPTSGKEALIRSSDHLRALGWYSSGMCYMKNVIGISIGTVNLYLMNPSLPGFLGRERPYKPEHILSWTDRHWDVTSLFLRARLHETGTLAGCRAPGFVPMCLAEQDLAAIIVVKGRQDAARIPGPAQSIAEAVSFLAVFFDIILQIDPQGNRQRAG